MLKKRSTGLYTRDSSERVSPSSSRDSVVDTTKSREIFKFTVRPMSSTGLLKADNDDEAFNVHS